MKHVLVSGGTGLVGRYIVEECLAAGFSVTVAGRTRPAEDLFYSKVGFRPLTLDPDRDQTAIFDGIDIFVHAAFQHVSGRYRGGEGDDPEGFIRQNRDGTIALFRAARRAGINRAVFLSSRAVYDGYPAGTELSESMTPEPESLYGKVKWEAEQAIAELAAPGFVPTSLRATGVYGDLSPNKWHDLFERYMKGEPVAARAGSEVHGRDLARAVLTVAAAPVYKVSGKAFNVSDIVTDTRAILSPLKSAIAGSRPLPERGDHESVSVMTTAKLNALGWRTGGIPLFDATLDALISDFLDRRS